MTPRVAVSAAVAGFLTYWFVTRARATPRRLSPREAGAGLDPALRVQRGATTGDANQGNWIRTRLAMARTVLGEMFPAMASATREIIARNAVAHWIRESGYHAEWHFNVGNLKAYPSAWHGPWYTLQDRVGPAGNPIASLGGSSAYRAYPSLKDGVRDYLRLISGGRYAPSWAFALRRPDDLVNWYRLLLSEGYDALTAEALREIPTYRDRVDQVAEGG